MRTISLRNKPRVSYYELEEPDWDEYIFCEKCADYVYEYCSIHGPLLVVLDDEVPAKSPYPPYVPRAALTIPHVFLHIAPSIIPGAGLGIFSTLALPRGVRFGPYKGVKTTEISSSMYCWQIYDRDHKPSHFIDAQDANKSNWMRYVNCARHSSEQNLVAYQYNGQLYYRTIKVIPRFTELMVFYGSEFAYLMGIDLASYNSPLGSIRKSGPPSKKRKIQLQKEKNLKVSDITEDKSASINDGLQGNSKSVAENITKNITHSPSNIIKQYLIPKSNAIVSSILNDSNCEQNLILQSNEQHNDSNNKFASESCYKDTSENINQSQLKSKDEFTIDTSLHVSKEISVKISNESNNVLDKKFSCHVCQYKTVNKSNLRTHLFQHTGEKPYKCDVCDYRFSLKSNLQTHIKRKHTNEKNYSCNFCVFKFVTKGDLKIHLRTHTGEKPYKCDVCNYRCTQKNSLITHINYKHTNEKNYSCNFCIFKCVTKSNLNDHLRKHTGEKPYKCHVCEHRSSQKGNLITHIKYKHTNEKNYSCNFCVFKCVTKGELNIHLRTHTGEKPYKCDVCDFRSSHRNSLITHIKFKHTNEKNYSCNFCVFKCVTKSNLNIHLRTHTGEKPYKCDVCNYRCTQKNSLITHIKYKHTNEKNYSCIFCVFKCVTKDKLNIHLRKHTGE